MKICPLRSTADKEVLCSVDCALYCENHECAIKNIGSADLKETIDEFEENLDHRLRNL